MKSGDIIAYMAPFLPMFLVFLVVGIGSVVLLVRDIKAQAYIKSFAIPLIPIMVVVILFSAISCWILFDKHILGGFQAYYDIQNENFDTVTGKIEAFGYGDQNVQYVTIDGQEYAYIRPEDKSSEYAFDLGSTIEIVYGSNSMYIIDIVE